LLYLISSNSFVLIYFSLKGYEECGRTIFNDPFIKFVVGGENAKKNKWIWQAAIYYFDDFLCGGTLIHKQYLVTAAHCLDEYRNRMGMDIVLGDNDRY